MVCIFRNVDQSGSVAIWMGKCSFNALQSSNCKRNVAEYISLDPATQSGILAGTGWKMLDLRHSAAGYANHVRFQTAKEALKYVK